MTMSDQIIAVLDNICAKFGIAIDWTSENVLPYVMELAGKFIKYEIVTSIAWCLIAIILAFVAYKICKWVWAKYNAHKMSYDWEMCAFISTVIVVCIIAAAICIVCCQMFDIVTCITFPEKEIFEYVSYMMKTV